jgi:DNA-directed RNA polymerase subunit RPC12/RpoP
MITGFRCSCGHRILAREIMQHGYVMTQGKPVFVYVKYRCSRCKRLGQKVVDYDRWDDSLLRQRHPELHESERQRLSALGPITDDEILQFHAQLVSLKSLDTRPLRRAAS